MVSRHAEIYRLLTVIDLSVNRRTSFKIVTDIYLRCPGCVAAKCPV